MSSRSRLKAAATRPPAKKKEEPYIFPYVRFHGRFYPLIPITLRLKKKKVRTFALLDSGASMSVFRPEIAEALGLRFSKRNNLYLGTATGRVHIKMAKVGVQVEKSKFTVSLGFSGKNAPSFNIIGREGFFHRFSVCFNEIMKTVILLPVDKNRL